MPAKTSTVPAVLLSQVFRDLQKLLIDPDVRGHGTSSPCKVPGHPWGPKRDLVLSRNAASIGKRL